LHLVTICSTAWSTTVSHCSLATTQERDGVDGLVDLRVEVCVCVCVCERERKRERERERERDRDRDRDRDRETETDMQEP
jgi:hypothetical protein